MTTEVAKAVRTGSIPGASSIVTATPKYVTGVQTMFGPDIINSLHGVPWMVYQDSPYDRKKQLTKYQVDTLRSLVEFLSAEAPEIVICITSSGVTLATGYLGAFVRASYTTKVSPVILHDQTKSYTFYKLTFKRSGATHDHLSADQSNVYYQLTDTQKVTKRLYALDRTLAFLPPTQVVGIRHTFEMLQPTRHVNESTFFASSAHTSTTGICPICFLGKEACIGHEGYGEQAFFTRQKMYEFIPLIASHAGANPQSGIISLHPMDAHGSKITTLEAIFYSFCWSKMAPFEGRVPPLVLHPVPSTPNPLSGISDEIRCPKCRLDYEKIIYVASHTVKGRVHNNALVIVPRKSKPAIVIDANYWAQLLGNDVYANRLRPTQRKMLHRAGLSFLMHVVKSWVYVPPSSYMLGDDVTKKPDKTLKAAYKRIFSLEGGETATGKIGQKNLDAPQFAGKKENSVSTLATVLTGSLEGKKGVVKDTASIPISGNLRATTIPNYPIDTDEGTIVLPNNRAATVEGDLADYSKYLNMGYVAAVELLDGRLVYANHTRPPAAPLEPIAVRQTQWVSDPNSSDQTIVHNVSYPGKPVQEVRFAPPIRYTPFAIEMSLIRRYYRLIVDGDMVLALRDPVIRRGAIVAYKVKMVSPEILGSDCVVGVPPNYFAKVGNGDNDGDQIPLVIPPSLEAQALLRTMTGDKQLSLDNNTLTGSTIGTIELAQISKHHDRYFRMWPIDEFVETGDIPDQQVDPEFFRVVRQPDGTWRNSFGSVDLDVEKTFARVTDDWEDMEDVIRSEFERTDVRTDYILGAHLLMCLLPMMPEYKYGEKSTLITKGKIGTYPLPDEPVQPTNSGTENGEYLVPYPPNAPRVLLKLAPGNTFFVISDTKDSKSSIFGHMMRNNVDVFISQTYFAKLILRFQFYNVEVGSLDVASYYSQGDEVLPEKQVQEVYDSHEVERGFITYNPEFAPSAYSIDDHRRWCLYQLFWKTVSDIEEISGLKKLNVIQAFSSINLRVFPKTLYRKNGLLTLMADIGSKLDTAGIRAGLGAKGEVIATTPFIDLPSVRPAKLPFVNISSLAPYGFSIRPIWQNFEPSSDMVAGADLVRALMRHALGTESVGKMCKTIASILATMKIGNNGRIGLSNIVM